MGLRSSLGIVTFNLGVSGVGFGGGYWGETIFFTKDNSIRKAIKDQLGRKLISESSNSDNLYSQNYVEYQHEIKASRFLFMGDVWNTERGGKLVKTWCEKALNLKLTYKYDHLVPYIVKWCVISQNIKHRLIDSGKKLLTGIEDDKEKNTNLEKNYKKYMDDSSFKRIILHDQNNFEDFYGSKKLMDWCSKILNRYSDNSETHMIYNHAQLWCVIDEIKKQS